MEGSLQCGTLDGGYQPCCLACADRELHKRASGGQDERSHLTTPSRAASTEPARFSAEQDDYRTAGLVRGGCPACCTGRSHCRRRDAADARRAVGNPGHRVSPTAIVPMSLPRRRAIVIRPRGPLGLPAVMQHPARGLRNDATSVASSRSANASDYGPSRPGCPGHREPHGSGRPEGRSAHPLE